ncbi:MAG: hypothetical protein MJ210_03465 [Alphaproteobacteria bacterium]|nr:hypothetical protein [Alphaproteobacteria bacterium]
MKKFICVLLALTATFGSVSASGNNDLTKEDKLKALALDGYTLDEVCSIIDFVNTDGEVLSMLMENSFYEGSSRSSLVQNFLVFPGFVQMQLLQRQDAEDILVKYVSYGGKFCRAAELYLLGKPYGRRDFRFPSESLENVSLEKDFIVPYTKNVIKAYQDFLNGNNHFLYQEVPERIIRHTLR